MDSLSCARKLLGAFWILTAAGVAQAQGADAAPGPGKAYEGTTVTACVAEPPGSIPPEMDPTCSDICPDAYCVPNDLAGTAGASLPACNEEEKCIPRVFVESLGEVRFKQCRSIGNAEGRCVFRCLPEIQSLIEYLPQADCHADEVCAPCFDPRTGNTTPACTVGCDEGPTEPPYVFGDCCGDAGMCVPVDIVPEAQRPFLRVDACTGSSELCAPKDLSNIGAFPCLVIPGVDSGLPPQDSGFPPGHPDGGGGNSGTDAAPGAGTCSPGQTQSCTCPGGATGQRTCAADGAGFGSCSCSPEAPSPDASGGCGCRTAPPPRSTLPFTLAALAVAGAALSRRRRLKS